MSFSEEQVRWFRLRRSGLVMPFATPESAASALTGVQAQILPAAGLALWNRSSGLTYRRLGSLLYTERSLVKLWGQRGTLHLYPSTEWPLIHAALAGRRTWWQRQSEVNGGDPERFRTSVEQVAGMLRRAGTLSRSDLRAAQPDLDEHLLSPWGGIFAELVLRGEACHAGQEGNEGRFAHRETWLPDLDWSPPPAAEANVELARRFLRVYGPATVQDLAYWRGGSVGDARRWIGGLGDAVVEVEAGGEPGLALRTDVEMLAEMPPPRDQWPVRLLYRFDPLLLGVKGKEWVIDRAHYGRVWRPAGHIAGTLVEHGRIAGTWRYDRKGGGLVVSVCPFDPLPAHVLAAVEETAPRIGAFFALPLVDLEIATG